MSELAGRENDVLAAKTDIEERARSGFARLFAYVCALFAPDSTSVSDAEACQLAASVRYVLQTPGRSEAEVLRDLATGDAIELWRQRRHALERRVDDAMELLGKVMRTYPPLPNLALRDTLRSLSGLPANYDTYFAAHEVAASIDYPLEESVSAELEGLDYVEAYLASLLSEARFLARFETNELEAYLSAWCPDPVGLHVNLAAPVREAWEAGELLMKGEGRRG